MTARRITHSGVASHGVTRDNTRVIQSGFSRVFWGTLIVAIDIHLNQFDVFVDLIGWIVMVGGLGRLRDLHPGFSTARAWAIVALLLSILDLGWLDTEYVVRETGGVTYSWDRLWPVRGVQHLCTLAVGWFVCRSCTGAADAQGLPELAAKARFRGRLLVILYVVGGIAMFVAWQDSGMAKLTMVLIPFAIVVGLLYLGLLRRAGRELREDDPDLFA